MRSYKRKTTPKYSQESLLKAVQDVKNGKFNSYQASKFYNIPRTTIVDRITRRRGAVKETRGRPTVIDKENEQRLATGLRTLEKYGFGLSAKETTVLVTKFVSGTKLQRYFTNGVPGYDWMAGFMKRHNLSIKKPQAVEMSRKAACDPFIIKEYFDTLEGCFNDLNLYMHPEKIWNLDESSFSMDPEKTKILGARGFASTRTIASTGKDNVTVLFTANAVGEKLPPLIVFRGKNVWDLWMSPNDFPGTKYAATKNGWMESDIFEKYMIETVFPCVGKGSLIIYDGHSTHIQLKVLEKAAELGITIMKLPSHTSHLLQPLDLAVFKSLKDKWDSKILKWQRLNIGKKLPKAQFSQTIGEVWQELDPKTIRSGFKKGGAYPLDKTVISDNKYDPASLKRFEQANNITVDTLPTLSSLCLQVLNKGNEKEQRQTKSKMIIMKPSDICLPGTSTGTSKIQILEDKIVKHSGIESFESLLLATLKKAENSVITKKRKVAKGCEVITRDYYIELLRKETEDKNKIAQEKRAKQSIKNSGSEKKTKKSHSNSKKKQPTKKRAHKKQQSSDDSSDYVKIIDTDKKVKQTRLKKKKLEKQSYRKQEYSKKSSDNDNFVLNDDDDDTYQDWNMFREKIAQNGKESSDSDHEMGLVPKKCGLVLHSDPEEHEPDVPQRLQINKWVVVKFSTKKTVKHFIGMVISLDLNRTPTIKFLRKNRNSKTQSFHYPVVEDVSVIKHEEDIVMALKNPLITRRGQVIFTDDLTAFNIQ